MTERNMTEKADYLKNFISMLNLRLYSMLPACPAENRVEARDRMARTADPSLEPDLEFSEAEVNTVSELLDMLTSENDNILSSAGQTEEPPRIEILRERFGLSANEMLLMTAM